ncbi:hypothetical protein [Companilactobacillus jidongensis]|uniref:hypothetical protein n=1 Tax=Companilactobacillus jidongensis TaxID=2486006 RepID=UPI0013DE38FC|nr:hypothetical protein [Companilactobacillus jidongensis]
MLQKRDFNVVFEADIKENKRSKAEEEAILKDSKDKVFSNPEVLAALKELSKM